MATDSATVWPEVLQAAEEYVRKELAEMDGSHDFTHIQRVRSNARNLARLEGLSDESTSIVDLAALLHDVRDWKYSGSDAATTDAVQAFLSSQGLHAATIARVIHIISRVGFKEELAATGGPAAATAATRTAATADCPPAADPSTAAAGALSLEAAIVQDADRLDAIGAIGIARCFTFGGAKHRVLHDPDVPPREKLSKEQYMKVGAQSTTLNHFYEKLLKLKGLMKTASGAKLAAQRHAFMEAFLQQFHEELAGRA